MLLHTHTHKVSCSCAPLVQYTKCVWIYRGGSSKTDPADPSPPSDQAAGTCVQTQLIRHNAPCVNKTHGLCSIQNPWSSLFYLLFFVFVSSRPLAWSSTLVLGSLKHDCKTHSDNFELVNWCFEPSQPHRGMSGIYSSSKLQILNS